MIKFFSKLHDHRAGNDLRRDDAGLTMLAYALGAAVIIVPMASAIYLFGTGAVADAGNAVEGVFANA
jgi:hypothetical protein